MATSHTSLLLAAASLTLLAAALPHAAAVSGTCIYCGPGYRLSCYVGDQSPPGPCPYGGCTSSPGEIAQLASCNAFPNRAAVGSHNCAGLICPDWLVADTPSGAVTFRISAVFPYAGACPDGCTNTECNPGWGQVCDASATRRLMAGRKALPVRARWAVTPTPNAQPLNDISAHLVHTAEPEQPSP